MQANDSAYRPLEFGDSLPPPPEDIQQFDSVHAAGKFAYALRSTLLKATHLGRKPGNLPPRDLVKKIVVVQMERLGDTILAEPALRALRMYYPHAHRTFIAPPFARALYGGSGWGEVQPPDTLTRLKKEYRDCDLLVDLTSRVETKLARRLGRTRIPCRVGLNRGGRGVYFTLPVKMPDITVPTREVFLRLTGILGAQPEDSIPRLPHGEDRLERGRKQWQKLDLNSPAVLLPGAYYPSQRWELKNLVTVAEVLKRKGLDVAVISGPGEDDLGRDLSDEAEVPWRSSPPMVEFMDMLATASVVICNNTGPLHLAAALSVPTVSAMGPTVPWRWWPHSDAPAVVFRGGLSGAVGDMDNINPLEVASAALHLAEKTSSN
ncbi:glycosyltransferase family 9 protein [Calditrichota bacterium]